MPNEVVTYKQNTLHRMMMSKLKMALMPSAKQRITQSMPVLDRYELVPSNRLQCPSRMPTIARIY